MSFFDDEVDEPRRGPRSQPRRSRPPGRRQSSGNQQSIQTRRTIGIVAVVVIVVLMALLIHSCQVSALNSSLRDYNNSVSSLIDSSDQTGQQVFKDLTSGTGASALLADFAQLLKDARGELSKAGSFSVPGEMSGAQQNVVLTMKMRRDGIATIANNIQPALGTTTSRDAITRIAGAMARFYASDVVYKGYAAPAIAAALNAAHLGVGGSSGNTINPGQFVTDLGWLQTGFIAAKLGTHTSAGGKNSAAPGLHGHSLNSVSVGSVTLSPSATNTLPASPAPTFQLSVTNGGNFNQFNVGCKVTIGALGDTGSSSISETTPGQTTSCSVPLPTAPTPGTYQVTASVASVPGESNLKNNTQTYTVTFQ